MARKLDGKVAGGGGGLKGGGGVIWRCLGGGGGAGGGDFLSSRGGAEGASVVVNYSSSREGADRIVGEINGNGGKAIAVQANVAKEGDVRRLFAETKKAFGRLDVLVNNAGVYEFKALEEITAQHFHW